MGGDIRDKIDILLLHLGGQEIVDVFDDRQNGVRHDLHFDFSRFDAGNIKKVIDEFDKVVGMLVDLFQTFFNLIGNFADFSGYQD
jgi:hypothetical protein